MLQNSHRVLNMGGLSLTGTRPQEDLNTDEGAPLLLCNEGPDLESWTVVCKLWACCARNSPESSLNPAADP